MEQRSERVHIDVDSGEPVLDDELPGIVGVSPAMRDVYRTARRAATARAAVLVTGEIGTGKRALARAIHQLSPRANRPFVTVSCAALAEPLLHNQLFGHEQTGAVGAAPHQVGQFEQANGGTLFLDEIGDLSMATQRKLLDVLQERAVQRIHGREVVPVDVRVIAATHRPLSAYVAAGRFREDLYYRLSVVRIEMPPLRERGDDILVLADHFLRKLARDNHRRVDAFSDGARAKILESRWSGNVRALEHAIERAVILCEGATIQERDLAFDLAEPSPQPVRIPGATLGDIERHAILSTLDAVDGSTSRAAEILAISVRKIQYRLHEYRAARAEREG